MFRHGLAGVCLVVAVSAFAGEAPRALNETEVREGAAIHLTVEGKQILEVPGLSRVTLLDPLVAEVRSLGAGRLELSGIKEGKTLLSTFANGVRTEHAISVTR